MRVIIKNADFSSVSIGKVEKDLSFDYQGVLQLKTFPWVNANLSAPLPWTDGNLLIADYLSAADSAESYTQQHNAARLVSDYIEVTEGMVIETNCKNTYNVPAIICYNANKEALGPSSTYCLWKTNNEYNYARFTVPAGVKYIVVNFMEIVDAATEASTITRYIKATMPSN